MPTSRADKGGRGSATSTHTSSAAHGTLGNRMVRLAYMRTCRGFPFTEAQLRGTALAAGCEGYSVYHLTASRSHLGWQVRTCASWESERPHAKQARRGTHMWRYSVLVNRSPPPVVSTDVALGARPTAWPVDPRPSRRLPCWLPLFRGRWAHPMPSLPCRQSPPHSLPLVAARPSRTHGRGCGAGGSCTTTAGFLTPGHRPSSSAASGSAVGQTTAAAQAAHQRISGTNACAGLGYVSLDTSVFWPDSPRGRFRTATDKVATRNVRVWYGRQKMVLERQTHPKRSRRTCTCEYALQSWRGASHPKSLTFTIRHFVSSPYDAGVFTSDSANGYSMSESMPTTSARCFTAASTVKYSPRPAATSCVSKQLIRLR